MRFQIESGYSRAEYHRLYRISLAGSLKSLRRALRAAWVISILLALLTLRACLKAEDSFHMLLNLLFTLVVLAYPALMARQAEDRSRRSYETTFGRPKLVIDEEGLHRMKTTGEELYRWDEVTGLYESPDAMYLTLRTSRGYILPARCFIEGDPAALPAFIEQNAGLERKKIK